MKKNWLTKLIALLVMAALLAPAAVAEGIANESEPAPAEQEPFDLGDAVTYGEQTVVIGGEVPFQGLAAPPVPSDDGETAADANGSTFCVKPRNVTVPVNGCVKAALACKPYKKFTYTCSDEEVVAVRFENWYKYQLDMWIYGLKEGTAELTFTSSSGDTAALTITVTPEAGGSTLSVSPASVTVRAGDTANCVLTSTTYHGSFNVELSDPDVASAGFGSWRGSDMPVYIFGLKKGSATITITNDQNEDVAVIQVQVTKGTKKVYPGKGQQDGRQKCRALLVGISDWAVSSQRMVGSAEMIGKALKTVKGPKGGAWAVTEKQNLTNNALQNAIHDTFSAADEDDISLFYIDTHGDDVSDGEQAGLLGLASGTVVLMGELAKMLKAVPGKVVILIHACGSGAGVYDTPTEQNDAMNALRKSAEGFDRAVIEAFALEDTCVADDVLRTTAAVGEAEPNTGELRVPDKFYVLTACRYHEDSMGYEYYGYNLFAKWLVDGIGRKGRMKADKNRDGIATLVELYKYIADVGDNKGFDTGEDHLHYQHVQIYPKNSDFKVFRRK